MRSNPPTEAIMKTRTFSGWKTRFVRALCCVALCGVMTIGFATGALAQDTPSASAVGADVAATPAEESAAQPASAAADAAVAPEPAPTISKPDTVWVLVSA